jgi:hypothetical protein
MRSRSSTAKGSRCRPRCVPGSRAASWNPPARRRRVPWPRHARDRHAAAIARSRCNGGARRRHRGPHPLRRDGRRVARGRQGARGAGARGGPPRRVLRQALRDPVGRRNHGHDSAARAGCAQGPGRARGRVLPGLGRRADGATERVGAGRRRGRHRRCRGQRRRLRRARHAGAPAARWPTTWTAATLTATSTRSATCWSPAPRIPTSTTSGR